MSKRLLSTLTELSSRKWISRLAGRIARSPASRLLIPRFARAYGIAVDEAEKALGDYATLNEFFTRRLKPGARPVDGSPGEDVGRRADAGTINMINHTGGC